MTTTQQQSCACDCKSTSCTEKVAFVVAVLTFPPLICIVAALVVLVVGSVIGSTRYGIVECIVTFFAALALLLSTCYDLFGGTGVLTCPALFGAMTKSRRKQLLKRAFVLRWLVCALLAVNIIITARSIASLGLSDRFYRLWLRSFIIGNATAMSPVFAAMILNVCVHGGIKEDDPAGVEATAAAVTTTMDAV